MSAPLSLRVCAPFLCGIALGGMFVAPSIRVTALAGNADQSTASAQNAPTFRSGVRLIEVDVFATDREGRFVRGLTQDDFELVEDGKAQDIRTFSVIDLPICMCTPASR
jgi:hypothetical protein